MKRYRFISGIFSVLLGAGVFLALPALLCAAENSGSEDLQLGDKALAAGDLNQAERFYRKALVLLADPLWEKGALKLCRVYIRKGDIASAAALLEEFAKRCPGRSTGVLPGMILAADGSLSEAMQSFKKVIAKNDVDKPEALYQLGITALGAGLNDDALQAFAQLAETNSPVYSKYGEYGRVYTLIRQNRIREAQEILKKTPQDETTKQLELLALIRSGDLQRFKDRWMKERTPVRDPRPEKLLYEICRNGADSAIAKGDREFAEVCLKDSFDFASDNSERQDVMRRLFNLQSQYDCSGAVETVKRYRERFPQASDKALLLIQGGRLLASRGMYKEAVELFSEVIRDEENLLDERRSAAWDAAVAAENGKLYKEAEKLLEYLIRRSTTPRQKQRSEFLAGEYYMRRKNYVQAEKYFEQVILQDGSEFSGPALADLLSVRVALGKRAQAKETAEKLLKAENPDHVNYGRFQLAQLTEQEGNMSRARELYLDLLKNAPQSSYAPAARFSAAQLAEKLGMLPDAVREFMDFAVQHPEDPNCAAALFLALRSDCLSGKHDTAEKALDLLQKQHASSSQYTAALLQLASYFYHDKKIGRALELLSKNNTTAAGKLLKARILVSSGNTAGALQEAKSLAEKFPAAPEAAEAFLLMGNIFSDLGENAAALQQLRQAEQLQKNGVFSQIVSGRIADCSKNLYSGSFDKKHLDEALKRYIALAESAQLPAVRLQSLCKAGSCYELAGTPEKAVEFYEKTLYFAGLLKSNGFAPDPVWCARAAYAGARQALKKRRPESLSRALRMIRLYEQLELPGTGEDFENLRMELRSSYNLLNQKGE